MSYAIFPALGGAACIFMLAVFSIVLAEGFGLPRVIFYPVAIVCIGLGFNLLGAAI